MNAKEEIRLSLIVARAHDGVIGHRGKMPWHLPSELAHFKRSTLGKPVLMGRKTWDSLFVQPLPGRENLVLSRDVNFLAPGAHVFDDFGTMLKEGKALAQKSETDEMVIIGGAMLYELALPIADRVYLTEVDATVKGDAWFADLPANEWALHTSAPKVKKPDDEYAYTTKIYDRIA